MKKGFLAYCFERRTILRLKPGTNQRRFCHLKEHPRESRKNVRPEDERREKDEETR